MTAPPDQPLTPRPGASAAVFREGRVLLVERAKPPLQAIWSLPGGHIEPGETALEAAHRELKEETGITANLQGIVDVLDVILRNEDATLRAHYVLTVFYGRWLSGEPCAASDCADARWVDLSSLADYRLTPGAADIIAKANTLLGC